jgi:predicted metal-binding membrane protein
MEQPDMMEAMMTLNPIAVTIFTISWTIGMAAMMFPAIIPMVFLYNRIISNEDNNNKNNEENDLSLVNKFKQHSNNSGRSENGQDIRSFSHLSKRAIKTSGFIGTYLLVWALTGVLLLVFWSIIMNDLLMGIGTQEFSTVSGILLIVSGIYQFSPLKERCLGYCESPLSFFMKRWKGKQLKDGLKMGLYHGMYCLGCCWPYFLLMIALGWMNILWMGMFASIIFVEKVWSRGIWISRVAGLMFVITGMLSITGIISISTEEDGTLNPHDEMNSMMTQDSSNGSDNMNMNIKDNMTMKVEIS